MRYIVFVVYVVLVWILVYVALMWFVMTVCGDSFQVEAATPANILALKAQNTAAMADAYADKTLAEQRGDWQGVREANDRIIRLHRENKQLHKLYESSSPRRNDDDDDPCGGAIADLQEMNNETAADAADDNLFQSAIRFLWFGVLVRLSLWLCWFLEWLLGWIPVLGLLIGIVLVLVAFLVMVVGYGLPGIIPFILVSL